MADELPSLQIDTDWKKQAQEEKRRLAEKAAAAKAATPVVPAAPAGAAGPLPGATPGESAEERSPFMALVQQMLTQSLFYLGEIAYRGAPPMQDLDRARSQHDMLTMLEEKTINNLTEQEQKTLDTALHEVRTRFIRAATEYLAF